jgi:hypothetical protein
MSRVRYELWVYIPAGDILHSHSRETPKSYNVYIRLVTVHNCVWSWDRISLQDEHVSSEAYVLVEPLLLTDARFKCSFITVISSLVLDMLMDHLNVTTVVVSGCPKCPNRTFICFALNILSSTCKL